MKAKFRFSAVILLTFIILVYHCIYYTHESFFQKYNTNFQAKEPYRKYQVIDGHGTSVNISSVLIQDPVLILNAPNSIIENMNLTNGSRIAVFSSDNTTIRQNYIESSDYSGIFVSNSNNVLIKNNIISMSNSRAINVELSSNVTIHGNQAVNNFEGIYVSESSNVSISNNQLTKLENYEEGYFEAGISLERSVYVEILQNEISGFHYGVITLNEQITLISDNLLYNNYDGMRLIMSNDTIIYNNKVDKSGYLDPFDKYVFTGSSIRAERSYHIEVINNTFKDAPKGWGIGFDEGSNFVISKNLLSNLAMGGISIGDSSEVVIEENTIKNIPSVGISIFIRNNSVLHNTNLRGSIIKNNNISDCEESGIHISETDNFTIMSNNISNIRNYGIKIGPKSNFNIVKTNYIEKTKYGIWLEIQSFNNVLMENTIKSPRKAIGGDKQSLENSVIEDNTVTFTYLNLTKIQIQILFIIIAIILSVLGIKFYKRIKS